MSYHSSLTRAFRVLSIVSIITLLFGTAPLSMPAKAQVTGLPISVLQYNVQFLTPWDHGMDIHVTPIHPIEVGREIPGHWPNVAARAQEIGQAIACHDIVVLNETVNDSRRRTILEAMQEYGRNCGREYLESVAGPDLAPGIKVPTPAEIADVIESGVSTPVIDDEVTIVSRFPIIERHDHIYTMGAGEDAFAAKGVIHARLWRGGDAPWYAAIDVFATHLQAGNDDIKQAQIQELTNFIRAHSSPGIPILVMGDFNITGSPDDANYNFMMSKLGGELGLIDIGEGLGGTNEGGGRRIDFILISQNGLSREGGFATPPLNTDGCTNVDADRNPRVNWYCSDNWPRDTMSDHAAVEAMLLWHDKPVIPPPPIHEPKHLSVEVTQLQAKSKDSCNQFMDFYGRIKLGTVEPTRFGIHEGNDIGPDWVASKYIAANTSPINAYIDVRDEDDFFCGGGDDDVDVNPSPEDRRLWLQIDLVANQVNLTTRDGTFIQFLGHVNQPIFVDGTSDDERGRMTFVVKSEPIPEPPEELAPGPKHVSVRVLRIQATSDDSCNGRLDSYAVMSLQDGIFDLNDFGILEGNDTTPGWTVGNRVSAHVNAVNFRIRVRDEDDLVCGGGDDEVDISPDPDQTTLLGQIDLISGQISLPDGELHYVQQGTPITIGGTNGRETANVTLEIQTPTLEPSSAFGHAGIWHPFFCVGNEACRVGDFNGDGKDDIGAFVRSSQNGEGVGDVWIALSNALSFDASSVWHPFFCVGDEVCRVGDFNGDGKDDIAAFVRNTQNGEGAGDVWVALSNGQGFDTSNVWHPFFCAGDEVCMVGDFNGDGKDDIAAFVRSAANNGGGGAGNVFVALSTGTDFQPQSFGALWHPFFCVGDEVCRVGDFNGDGKDDIAAFVRNTQNGEGVGDVWVALSNGQSFETSSVWNPFFCVGDEVCQIGDFNGDGKADIVAFVRGGGTDNRGNTWVAVSSGQEFIDASPWNDFFCFGDCATGDFDGNGAYDVINFTRSEFQTVDGSLHFGAQGNVYTALSLVNSFTPPIAPEPEAPHVNLSVRQYTSADFIVPGEMLTHTIEVLNEGNLMDQNVSLSSTLPEGFNIVSVQANQGSCTSTNPVTCQIGDMAAKASVSIEIVVRADTMIEPSTLTKAEPATFTTLTTVASSNADSDITDNSESISVSILETPRIEVVTTVSTDKNECSSRRSLAVRYATLVYYCYIITNTGNTPVEVHDITDTELGDILRDTTFVLDPGERITSLELGVIVVRNMKITTTSRITWMASVVSGPFASADSTVTVRVRGKDD